MAEDGGTVVAGGRVRGNERKPAPKAREARTDCGIAAAMASAARAPIARRAPHVVAEHPNAAPAPTSISSTKASASTASRSVCGVSTTGGGEIEIGCSDVHVRNVDDTRGGFSTARHRPIAQEVDDARDTARQFVRCAARAAPLNATCDSFPTTTQAVHHVTADFV
jgi:hypothetical protein